MLAFVDLEERIPHGHSIRTIKALADEALERLSPEFDRMYAQVGRASVPPERLQSSPDHKAECDYDLVGAETGKRLDGLERGLRGGGEDDR